MYADLICELCVYFYFNFKLFLDLDGMLYALQVFLIVNVNDVNACHQIPPDMQLLFSQSPDDFRAWFGTHLLHLGWTWIVFGWDWKIKVIHKLR